MGELTDRWTCFLSEAERLLPRYLEATSGLRHESKGIRRSELFFLFALTVPLRPNRILESGRARGQSTLGLARLFPRTTIVSLEADSHSADVAIARDRLQGCANVDCRFGDSRSLLPQLVRPGDVVLIDGPKDFRALKLALRLLRDNKPAGVFVHDLWLGSPARSFVERRLPTALLSDDPSWVTRFATLDSRKPRMPLPADPDTRVAYGATLGFFSAGAEDYGRRFRQCRRAQGAGRLRETARKFLRRPPIQRPPDFAPFLAPGRQNKAPG